jgi:metal-responsive CopG/Arc/MetJ family transcriptional regulator
MNTQLVTFTVPLTLLSGFDRVVRKQAKTRSESIRDYMRKTIIEEQEWNQVFAYGRRQAKKLGIKTEDDVQHLIDEVRQGK